MSKRHLGTWILVSFSAVISLGGCSGKKVNDADPAALFKEAEEDIKSDHYIAAIDKLKLIKNKFGYSKYAAEAQLRLGDVYYMEESYGEAATTYEQFRDLHPKHEKAAYAMFRVAESYYNDIPGNIARDLTSATKAQEAYNAFLKRFPSASEAEDARKHLADTRSKLANKELYIGNFYYREDQYESAKRRYEKVLELYPETPEAKEAKRKLDKSLAELNKQGQS